MSNPPQGPTARWKAVFAFAMVLLVGAVVPSPLKRHPAFSKVGPDKLLHFLGHAGFATVLADAIATGRLSNRTAAVFSVGLSSAYGILIGQLQRSIPGRLPERADLIAGILGSILGVLGWRRFTKTQSIK